MKLYIPENIPADIIFMMITATSAIGSAHELSEEYHSGTPNSIRPIMARHNGLPKKNIFVPVRPNFSCSAVKTNRGKI